MVNNLDLITLNSKLSSRDRIQRLASDNLNMFFPADNESVHNIKFDNKKNTTISVLQTNQVISYIKPFFLNNLAALFFVLLTMPLVVKILSSDEYVIYTLAIQASGVFLFLYRGLSKNILAGLYARKARNVKEEKFIIIL